MKRLFVYIVIVLVVTVPLVYFWLANRSSQQKVGVPVDSGGLPTAESGSVGRSALREGIGASSRASDTLSIGTRAGSVVVTNPYTSAIYADEGFLTLRRTENYEIAYNLPTSGFVIYILTSPFAPARAAAEADLLAVLGVGQGDACKLSVIEKVSAHAGGGASGEIKGLSFCPAGVE